MVVWLALGIVWVMLAANLVGMSVGKWAINLGGIATALAFAAYVAVLLSVVP